MKWRNLKKKVGVILLASMLTVTLFPIAGTEVHAAGAPDSTQFATVDELRNFDTNNGTENKAAKVYFGLHSQKWWIAGSQQENGLTLFAENPSATNQQFESNWEQNKTDSSLWDDCTYPDGTTVTEVYPNHYGASALRTTLKGMETSYFTGAEQSLMKETTVYMNDVKNNSVYSISDKLYLPYGEKESDYIMVGTNSQNSLNSGLRVDTDYWGYSNFWLSTPYANNIQGDMGLYTYSDIVVNYARVNADHSLVPAFELNLSNVSFASAAPIAASDGDLTLQDTDGYGAFTLRYKSDNLGAALVSYDKSKVTLTGVPSGTCLVVQYKDGAKAKQINNETEVSASTDFGLDSFENCKVWLETTDFANKMTYATLAEVEQSYSINVTANTGLKIISNNGVQEVATNTEITDITVEVEQGYELPNDYISKIQGLNGLTVTETASGFTITGIPTGDVNIALAPAKKVVATDPGEDEATGAGDKGTTTGESANGQKMKAEVAKTGDNSHFGVWISLLAISVLGTTAIMVVKHRRKYN